METDICQANALLTNRDKYVSPPGHPLAATPA
jgi:hypothetical protein